ncbi:hypothetical protein BKA58DRAFT_450107 [Alternaria rosae]|uniref:uncharacterized protein n=1 Tax=Alternaria rosae TaxID=1187941 RepID=UPI001E8E2A54|nr:uncharacterized protein BKA58DRAFT_450107 [Alternaria rosae]KAH6852808.1 hypothetical protein BKA58DRAFT_450107 [Alternaria rosae]
MATSLLPLGGIALVGAPDSDAGLKDDRRPPVQAMQVDITQDIVDELLASVRSGKSPQIIFGRTPQLKYGDKTHMLQSSSELHRYELYKSSGTGSPGSLEFAGMINHSLMVHKAEDVTAGVDSALEQLRSNMAAISEFKEANNHDVIVSALRVPIIHLLAREPATEASLAATCRTSLANIRDVLPKIAKRSTADADKWQLTDKSFREVNPFKFPYQSAEDRQQAIDGAIKSFDRQRLAKDDKLWQILLPRDQRGQGICLSRSTKKTATKKAADKPAVEKKPKAAKEVEIKPKSSMKEKYLAREKAAAAAKEVRVKEVKEEPTIATAPASSTPSSSTPRPRRTCQIQHTCYRRLENPQQESTCFRRHHQPTRQTQMAGRDSQRDRPANRPFKPTMPINTKPKNPSPLDFEDSHPVHKALAAAPSPAKSGANSDRSLKRKANDIDSDIHNHNLAVKKPKCRPRNSYSHPLTHQRKANGSTPSSTSSLKRKSDDSSSSNTPTTAPKVRKVANIDTGLASRYHHNNPRASPGASSTSTTSPSMPNLSFRQTVELSQKFQEVLQEVRGAVLAVDRGGEPPTEAQRNDLLKMHKKLEK